MKAWALAAGASLVLVGCGGRTGPIDFELSTSAGGSGQGGSSSIGAGGSSNAGGLGATGGWGGFGGVSGGSTSTPAPPVTRRWLAARAGNASAPELYLVGIRSDHEIEVHPLRTGGANAELYLDGLGFSESGKRFAYGTRSANRDRFWVVELNATSFTSRELRLPANVSSDRCSLRGWLTDVLLLVDCPSGSVPVAGAGPIVLSADPKVPVPAGTPDDGQRSPDGTKSAKMGLYVENFGAEAVVRRVDENHMAGETLLSLNGVSSFYWSPDSRRLGVSRQPWTSPSVVVYDFPDSGPPTELDRFAPASGSIVGVGFSPDARFAVYDMVLSNRVETRIRDLVKHIDAVVRFEGDTTSFYGLDWLAHDRVVAPDLDTMHGGPFQTASVTEATVATGSITLARLGDPYESLGNIVSRARLGDGAYLALRASESGRTLQSLQLTDRAVLTTNLLPGTAGVASPGVLGDLTTYDGLRALVIPAAPSYYYLTFDGVRVAKAVKLADFFDENYFGFNNVLNAGIIARHTKTKASAWLYLDAAEPGPLVPIPITAGTDDTVYYYPPKWPTF